MGVWIETIRQTVKAFDAQSHPAWVCGLKLKIGCLNYRLVRSHPAWVCGLKPPVANYATDGYMSHPAWVCGLKLPIDHT